MKTGSFIVSFLVVLMMTGCPTSHTPYCYSVINNSKYPVVRGIMYSSGYDTMFNYKPAENFIKPKTSRMICDRYRLEDLIERSTYKRCSFFFFHSDTLKKYPLEILQRDYKILQRYDLSSQDILKLYDGKKGSTYPQIPYPPDERMKDMKMWPPYGSE